MSSMKRDLGVLEIYTHGFKITSDDPRVKIACRRVLNEWIVRTDKKVENSRGELVTVSVPTQVFGTEFNDGEAYWFHKGQFKEVEHELKCVQIHPNDFKVEYIKRYTPDKINIKLKEGRVLRDYQTDARGFALENVSEGDHFSKLIAMPTGMGKSASTDTAVITTGNNVIKLSSLQVGKRILCADGYYHEVLGIFPQGIRPTYIVQTEDNRCEVFDTEHLWDWTDDLGYPEIKQGTTLDLLNSKDAYIPLYNPFKNNDDILESNDSGFIKGFFEFKELSITDDGLAVYQKTHSSETDDIIKILLSLGFMAFHTDEYLYFRSPRILDFIDEKCFTDDISKLNLSKWLKIESITENGPKDCVCISVASGDELFVTSNYIVTHNTVTICGTIGQNSERAVISVLPKYFDKWLLDLQSNLDVSAKQIMPVEKSSQLKGLIHLLKEQGSKKIPPLIVMTLTCIEGFISDYEKDPKGCIQDYGCAPWEIWGLLKAGIVGVDEAHEHIYKVFKLAMYLHGPKFIALSGTMRTEDAFQERVQNLIFPKIKRYEEVKMEKYIDVEFIGYHFSRDMLHKIKYQAFGRNDYSHAILEKSILRYPRLLAGYIKIVTGILDWDFMKVRKEGEKAIIYVATVDMADKFMNALVARYPQLKISRYCAAQGDKYADLLSSDITVSTIQSSGTAVDIPNLICNICTTMVNSSKSNIQVLGRLRKLPDNRKVTLYMPFCKDIKKHFKYTQFRYELFKDITKSIKTFNYGNKVGDDY